MRAETLVKLLLLHQPLGRNVVGSLTLDVVGVTLALLLILGHVAAHLGCALLSRGALRAAFWGAEAMGCTAAVGHLFGAVV